MKYKLKCADGGLLEYSITQEKWKRSHSDKYMAYFFMAQLTVAKIKRR
jgi:hypothetical protein